MAMLQNLLMLVAIVLVIVGAKRILASRPKAAKGAAA
jgi:hypothetical protein